MQYVKPSTKETFTFQQLKREHGNVSFPATGPGDQWLGNNGYATVVQTAAPSVGLDEIVTQDGVELVDGEWRTKWLVSIKEYTAGELSAYLSEYREQKVVEGITFGGLPIGGDDKTMLRVAGARIKADADPTFTTKWNGVASLEATAIIAISDKLLSHVDKCFDAYGAVDLTGLTTKEQVEAAFDAAYEAL